MNTKSPLSKILLVEDERRLRQVAKLSLEKFGGFEVMSCENGEEALQAAPDFNPDIVLLDVRMPGLSGPETLMELRKIGVLEHTSVVLMTANVGQADIETYRQMGALDVIEKPFNPKTLGDHLRSLWDGLQCGESTLDVEFEAGLSDSFAADLAEWMIELETASEDVRNAPVDGLTETFRVVRELAHKIGGTAGIFGFQEICDVAHPLEDHCIPFVDHGRPCLEEDRKRLLEMTDTVLRIHGT